MFVEEQTKFSIRLKFHSLNFSLSLSLSMIEAAQKCANVPPEEDFTEA